MAKKWAHSAQSAVQFHSYRLFREIDSLWHLRESALDIHSGESLPNDFYEIISTQLKNIAITLLDIEGLFNYSIEHAYGVAYLELCKATARLEYPRPWNSAIHFSTAQPLSYHGAATQWARSKCLTLARMLGDDLGRAYSLQSLVANFARVKPHSWPERWLAITEDELGRWLDFPRWDDSVKSALMLERMQAMVLADSVSAWKVGQNQEQNIPLELSLEDIARLSLISESTLSKKTKHRPSPCRTGARGKQYFLFSEILDWLRKEHGTTTFPTAEEARNLLAQVSIKKT